MTIAEFIRTNQAKLGQAGIGSARLDCLILLEDEFGKDRAWILANQEQSISSSSQKLLDKKIKLRITHEPLAYIRGFSEFYGRHFLVNKNVLEPRPESETMIEMLKKEIRNRRQELVIADIGTGSGALAITAKLEIPGADVIATDIDDKCLAVARKNAKKHQTEVKFLMGDLLSPLPSTLSPDLLLANLPYVPRNVRLNQSAAMEPRLAIDGGSDGLEIYRRFFAQIKTLKHQPKYILTESLPPQHRQLAEIAAGTGYKLAETTDLIQLFKR